MVDALNGMTAAPVALLPATLPSSDRAAAVAQGDGGGHVSSGARKATELSISDQAQHHSIQEYANEAAKAIRQADRSLGQLQQHLTKMRDALDAIVKQYPPFQPSDAQRVQYLKSFSGLRAEIEALTMPPESAWSGKVVGEVRIPDASALQSVPVLDPAKASDSQVASVLANVQQALTTATSLRTDLARQVGH